MPICYLEKDIELEKLEKRETPWYEIIDYLALRWRNHPNNLQYLLRLGTQCWGELVFSDLEQQNRESSLYSKSEKYLSETLQYGLHRHNDHFVFLCLYGYLISLFPYYFALTGDYDRDCQFGKDMINKAYKLQPDDILSSYLASDVHSPAHNQAEKNLKQNLFFLFPGNSEMDIYFRSVWG